MEVTVQWDQRAAGQQQQTLLETSDGCELLYYMTSKNQRLLPYTLSLPAENMQSASLWDKTNPYRGK